VQILETPMLVLMPAVREPAAFIFCLPIPPVCLLVFLLVSAAIGDENYFKFN
jgi:cytochrome c oxidase subunit IV